MNVGCERDDGLLNVHPESETCEVCKEHVLQDELSDLLYSDDGETIYKKQATTDFPTQAVKEGAIVIVCGFLP